MSVSYVGTGQLSLSACSGDQILAEFIASGHALLPATRIGMWAHPTSHVRFHRLHVHYAQSKTTWIPRNSAALWQQETSAHLEDLGRARCARAHMRRGHVRARVPEP